jgi:hypothetical protein
LKEYPHIPPANLGIFFIFLAHDPLFGGSPDLFPPPDPEFIEPNRSLVLKSLELIFLIDKKRTEKIEANRKGWAEALWLLQQIKPYVPAEIKERIQMEFELNKTDPDFDFAKEAFGEKDEAIQPLSASKVFKSLNATAQ